MCLRSIIGIILLLVFQLVSFPSILNADEDQEQNGTSEPLGIAIENEEDEVAVEEDPIPFEFKKLFSLNLFEVNIFIRLGIALVIILVQALFIRFSLHLFVKLHSKTSTYAEKYLKPLTIKKYRLLETKQILETIFFMERILKYVVIAFQLYITLPLVLGFFEPTRNISRTLFLHIVTPIKETGLAIIKYIPNLIAIAIIIFIVRYVIRALKFFSSQIERGKLVINGFYPDWAQPTFNILRVLLYAFTIIVIYPYLPGSDSAIFQGVSVFVGVIFSLSSSSAIGNLIAGMVITYMRPFKIGDRIKIGEVVGYVVEKSATVTRLRTVKNEYVTFPNQTVLTSSIINYNFSSREKEDGLILYADVTMGYAVPWRKMHELLIAAAEMTIYTQKTPKPFVLQTALDNYYCRYQINVYTKEIGRILAIYSDLYQNIQDVLTGAGLDLTAPIYEIHLPYEAQSITNSEVNNKNA